MRVRFTPHIAFQVHNYGSALAFYRDVLGMEVLELAEGESRLRAGDATFYLEDAPNEHVFLAFEVDDLDAARNELAQAGCSVSAFDGEGYMVSDPFGLKFYLSEHATPPLASSTP